MHLIFRWCRHVFIASCMTLVALQAATAEELRGVPSNATDMPTVVPNKQETAESVFAKLDSGQKGYIVPADVTVLPGFDKNFQSADADQDSKLSLPEFKEAWAAYTGNSSTEGLIQ